MRWTLSDMNEQKTMSSLQDLTIHRYFHKLVSMLLPHTNFRENPNKMILVSIVGPDYRIVSGVEVEGIRCKLRSQNNGFHFHYFQLRS